MIDANFYPVIEAENSNFRHRPVGLGIQGLADAFIMLRLPFTSDEAKKLNQDIFETMYFAAVTSSMEIAKAKEPYSTFKGSPMSEGEFQYILWGIKDDELSGNWDWAKLRKQVMKHGVRNSLLVAPMPTASTSQILGNNEAFEPYTSNIYTRRVLSGEFIVVNKHLLEDLVELGLWDNSMKEDIMRANGSIQHIEAIPAELRELVQNSLGNEYERYYRYGSPKRIFYRSISIFKLVYERSRLCKINLDAFLCMEVWIKNRNVLFKNKISSECDSVHTFKRKESRRTRRTIKPRRIQSDGRCRERK